MLKKNWQIKKQWLKKHNKIVVITIIILFLSLLTKFLFLEKIPPAFSHDEMGYLINALSVSITGFGKSGEWFPLSFTPVEPTLAELPTLFFVPFFYLPFSLTFNLRLLHVFMGITIPFFIAFISYFLTKSKSASYFTWVLALFNPWLWQMSRLTFDVMFSWWFYLLGILIFLWKKRYGKLWSIIPFILGFYCYQGFKLLLIPIVLLLNVYQFFSERVHNKKINKKNKLIKQLLPSLIILFVVIILFIFYFIFQYSSQLYSKNKLTSQLLTPNSELITSSVQKDRRLAITTPINSIFINKYLQLTKEIYRRYLEVFGLHELFFEISANNSSFTVWNHGIMYPVLALLIVIGSYQLIRSKQYNVFFLLSSMIIISAFPSVINENTWLFFRSSFIIPFFLIIAGVGVSKIWKKDKLFIIFTIIYSFSIINFAFLYFIRYPVYGSENIFFSPRLVVEYIRRTEKDKKIIVFATEPDFIFINNIFYNNLFTSENAILVQNSFKKKEYIFQNISYYQCIPFDFKVDSQNIYIFDSQVQPCYEDIYKNTVENIDQQISNNRPIYIKSIKDSGTDYKIFNDDLCDYQILSTYIYPHQLSVFNFEELSNEQFCDVWITKDL